MTLTVEMITRVIRGAGAGFRNGGEICRGEGHQVDSASDNLSGSVELVLSGIHRGARRPDPVRPPAQAPAPRPSTAAR